MIIVNFEGVTALLPIFIKLYEFYCCQWIMKVNALNIHELLKAGVDPVARVRFFFLNSVDTQNIFYWT